MKTSLVVAAMFVSQFALAQTPAPVIKNAPAEPPAMQPPDRPGTDLKGSIKLPRVYFVEPQDGATVSSPVAVKFAVEGMKIAKGKDQGPGTGHFHIVIDGPAIEKGQTIPHDDKHMHFGAGETSAKLKLSKGEHTLTLQFSDGQHSAYGEMLSQTIHITVK